MELTKTLLNKESLLKASQFCILLSIIVFAPVIGNQLITGSIVNALLLISAMVLGLSSAILLSLLPSAISLSLGFLPWVMAPMVPFIILGNIIFVFSFDYLRKNNYWLGAISGSFLKFVFLFISSNVVITLFIKQTVATKIAAMMSWPQLITSLLGSMIAFFVWEAMNK